MASEANWMQRVSAFIDPTVSVNNEGFLVEQDGFFDWDSSDGEYLTYDDIMDSSIRQTVYYPEYGMGNDDGLSGIIPISDTEAFSDSDNFAGEIADSINDAALQQQEAAQNSADRAMEFEKDYAEQYMNFQREMAETAWNRELEAANTSYQRAIADLKAAGLNPKLVAKIGGATTPSYDISSTYSAKGKSASMQMASVSALSNVLTAYINGANAMDRKELDFIQSVISSIIRLFG